MNIFYLDTDPWTAAKSMHNKHICKMMVESCQMLANAFDAEVLEREAPKTASGTAWKHSHFNHPSAVWVRQSAENYLWLLEHATALYCEYTFRYEKTHSCEKFVRWASRFYSRVSFPSTEFTPPPRCMPDQYKSADTVAAYRAYYVSEKLSYTLKGKRYCNKWPSGCIPKWVEDASSAILNRALHTLVVG